MMQGASGALTGKSVKIGPPVRSTLKVLVLSTFDGTKGSAIRDFLFSFRSHSKHEYYYVFDCRTVGRDLELSAFDVILVFWTVYLVGPDISEELHERIRKTAALKVVFRQDEYADVRAVNQAMSELGTQVVFTLAAEADHSIFFPRSLIPTLEGVYTVLPGYVPAHLEGVSVPRLEHRALDIGYRSRAMPYYLGDLAQEKRTIAERFEAIAGRHGLRCDISVREQDRLYGRRWMEFLRSSRCVLGTASGASVIDFTGEIRRNCERYLALKPDATYEEVKSRFFADVDWRVVLDTVSPRVFEATALGCALVQHEGRYAGILRPDEHYIRVRRDYSNIDDVIERIKDRGFCELLAARAYAELIVSGQYNYRAFAQEFDRILARHVRTPLDQIYISQVAFYGRRYARHGQAIIPCGRGFVVLPSRRLIHEVARWALSKLPRRHWGPAVSRMIENPAEAFGKGLLALRVSLMSPRLRKVLWAYCLDRQARVAIGLSALLNDLLKLDIARRVRAGALISEPRFELAIAYDGAEGALSLRSTKCKRSDLQGGPSGCEGAVASEAEMAILRGEVKTVVWDHSAISQQIIYQSRRLRWVTVGFGAGGVYRFEAIEELYRRTPSATAAALLAVLSSGSRTANHPEDDGRRTGEVRG